MTTIEDDNDSRLRCSLCCLTPFRQCRAVPQFETTRRDGDDVDADITPLLAVAHDLNITSHVLGKIGPASSVAIYQ